VTSKSAEVDEIPKSDPEIVTSVTKTGLPVYGVKSEIVGPL